MPPQAGRAGDGKGKESAEGREEDGVEHEVAGLPPDEGGVHRAAVAQQQRGDRDDERDPHDDARERFADDARVEPRGPCGVVDVSGCSTIDEDLPPPPPGKTL